MSTAAQISANCLNAQSSTGPRTEPGKAASSRNAQTNGLYTRRDYVLPGEREFYAQFCDSLLSELAPASPAEHVLAAEITGASWRLHRCTLVEGEIALTADRDPMLDDKNEKTIRSLDRARTSALNHFNKGINQLRKLQTGRACSQLTETAGPSEELASFCKQTDDDAAAVVDEAIAQFLAQKKLASNCRKPDPPRNAPCPCGSGLKFKRCCYRKGPGWEQAA